MVMPQQFNPDWVKNGITDATMTFADEFGGELANNGRGLTTSQIRNFFGELRRIQMNGIEKEFSSFLLLEPKLAYAVKRRTNTQGKEELEKFFKLFQKCKKAMDLNEKEKLPRQFNNLLQIMEAIIAFHKFHNGKE
jgi:CRISPR-associated protein Csm2